MVVLVHQVDYGDYFLLVLLAFARDHRPCSALVLGDTLRRGVPMIVGVQRDAFTVLVFTEELDCCTEVLTEALAHVLAARR